MRENLQTDLWLPKKAQDGASAGDDAAKEDAAEAFERRFREILGRLNEPLRVLSVDANGETHQQHDAKRAKVIEAYQKTNKQAGAGQAGSFEKLAERVIAAAENVANEVSQAAANAVSHKQAWQHREPEFDEAVLGIGELEEAGNPKTLALRKVVEVIQSKADGKHFREALSTLESWLPKSTNIYGERQTEGQSASPVSPDDFFAELEAIENAVDQLIAEHQLDV